MQEILDAQDPRVVEETLRMPLSVFSSLQAVMLERCLLSSSKDVDISEKLAIFLVAVGHGHSNGWLQVRFQRSEKTISNIFDEVLRAMMRLSSDYICLPASDQKLASRIRDDSKYYPYFKDCLGALDGTHIDAYLPGEKRILAYRNRKGRFTQNVLTVCSFDMEFVYVLAGWEGSAEDARVLRDAVWDKGFSVPPGKYYLGDAMYSNSEIVLAPYRGVRYHFNEKALASFKPANHKELFNMRHDSLRNVVDRSVEALKKRFQVLQKPPEYPYETQVELIGALCGLNNFIRQESMEEGVIFEHGPVDIDNDLSKNNSRGAISTSISSAMGEKRDKIAEAMWEEYQTNLQRS